LISVLVGGAAFAEEGPYVAGFAGLASFPDAGFDQDVADPDYASGDLSLEYGFDLNGAIGYDLGGILIEAQIGRAAGGTDTLSFPDATAPFDSAETDGDVSIVYGMVNGWIEIPTEGPITPFVGGGIGYASLSIDTAFTLGSNNGIDSSDTVFAYQIGAGATYALSETNMLAVRYRYLTTGDGDFTDNEDTAISAGLSAHIFDVGVRFSF
ncbi:MAG: outer membrane protein, partial [Rubricella sp.]